MTAYEVSISKLAAFDNAEDFDIETEFDLYAFRGDEGKTHSRQEAALSESMGMGNIG